MTYKYSRPINGKILFRNYQYINNFQKELSYTLMREDNNPTHIHGTYNSSTKLMQPSYEKYK